MKNEIIVVLDRSGSMAGIKSDMVGGLRTFVEEQRKVGEAGFTLARFDEQYEVVMEGVPLSKVNITDDILVPRNRTALLDALGRTVTLQGERFAKMAASEKPERVVLLVITDGLENASREWTRTAVAALLKRQQDEWKWGVTILGCGIDAITQGQEVAIPMAAALSVGKSSEEIGSAFAAAGSLVAAYRSTGAVMSYSPEARARALRSHK